jgi:hypothetical protein
MRVKAKCRAKSLTLHDSCPDGPLLGTCGYPHRSDLLLVLDGVLYKQSAYSSIGRRKDKLMWAENQDGSRCVPVADSWTILCLLGQPCPVEFLW